MKFRISSEYSRKNTVFFVVMSLICFLLASSVLPFFDVFGKMPCPDLLICFCCMLPRFCGKRECCIYALSLGFVSDLFINMPYSLSPVIYLAAVLLPLCFYSRLKSNGTVSAAVCALPALAIYSVWEGIVALFVKEGVRTGSVIWYTVIPEIIVNFACVLVVGFVLKALTKVFGIQKENV